MADKVQYYARDGGNRQSARVYLRPGSGEFASTAKSSTPISSPSSSVSPAKRSLVLTEHSATFDVVTTVSGGGVAAQADASRWASRGRLLQFNASCARRSKAKAAHPRRPRQRTQEVGQKAPDKRFQFSKR